MKEEDDGGEYLHGFVSADEDFGDDDSLRQQQEQSSPAASSSRRLLFGGGSTRRLVRRSSSSSASSLCSQYSLDSQSSHASLTSNASMNSSVSSFGDGSRSRSRRRRRRRRSSTTTAAASGGTSGHSEYMQQHDGQCDEGQHAPTLAPRSDRAHEYSQNGGAAIHASSIVGMFSAGGGHSGRQQQPPAEEDGAKGTTAGQEGTNTCSAPRGADMSSGLNDAAAAAGSTCEKNQKRQKKLQMDSVIRPAGMAATRTAATAREGGLIHGSKCAGGGILRHSSYGHRHDGHGSDGSSEEGESSDTSSSILSQASGSTSTSLSSLSVQSASRMSKTYRHNQSRLIPTSSPSSDDASSTTSSSIDLGEGRGGSLGHMTQHAVYDMMEGGYTSSSTLDSSPYFHDFRIPMPLKDGPPNLSRTMFGSSTTSTTCTNNETNFKSNNQNNNINHHTMYQRLRTTSRHMQSGWKPFLQTPSGHILTRPDYAAIDSEDRPLSRSNSFDTFSVSSLPTVHTASVSGNGISNSNTSVASGACSTKTAATDITVSDEVFSYYGSFRGFLLKLSRRFYHAPLCRLLRRPSFPTHVSPTPTAAHAHAGVRDDAPPRQRLVRSVRDGAEFVRVTAAHQWQRHSRLLVLSAMVVAVTYMLSFVPMYETTISPQVQGGGNVGDEFGTGEDDYSSPSSAGYQRKVGQLGLIDPNNPSILAPPADGGASDTTLPQQASTMAGGYYTIPKEYQILMPSSMGGGASPATNLVRLGPLANLAYVTEPIRENDVPLFWHISRAGGSTIKHVMGQCLGLVISSDYGSQMNLLAEDHLRVVTADHGGKYVNVDTSTIEGIERARSMGLVESNMAEVIVTQYLYRAASLFNVNQRGRLFTVFRDPVERAVSMFHYLQVAHWEPTYDPLLSQISLLDYARSERVEHNWVTRVLSDTLDGPLNENHLELAKAVIRQKCLVGLLSRKGETVERFKEAFGWDDKYPEFEKIVTEEERKLEMTRAEECADKLLHMDWPNKHRHPTVDDVQSQEYAQLYEVNRFDIELYKYAERIFDEQSVLFLPPYGVYFRESRRK